MNLPLIFLILILGLPALELYVLIDVGGEIGAIPTIFLVVFTAVLGGILVRRQGLSTVMRVREAMNRGEVPALPMLEGAVLLLGGLLLLIPGFLTDAMGFFCLIPPLRQYLLASLVERIQVSGSAMRYGGETRTASQGQVIEGEFRKEKD